MREERTQESVQESVEVRVQERVQVSVQVRAQEPSVVTQKNEKKVTSRFVSYE